MMALLVMVVLMVGSCTGVREDHIIGGQEAAVGAHPYQCSLQKEGKHICGCVIISQWFIISAAHCFDPMDMPDSVVVGLHDLIDSSIGSPRRHNIANIHTHPGFDAVSLTDNIAIAMTSCCIDIYSPYVSDIPMATSGSDYQNTQGVITGWGYIDGMRSPSKLQAATVNIFPNTHCIQRWGSNFKKSGMVCIGETGTTGACMGDSGGALQVDGILVGITSFGPSNCTPLLPSVCTRVAGYRAWIQSITGL